MENKDLKKIKHNAGINISLLKDLFLTEPDQKQLDYVKECLSEYVFYIEKLEKENTEWRIQLSEYDTLLSLETEKLKEAYEYLRFEASGVSQNMKDKIDKYLKENI
jgi:hypothetical protein